MYDVENGIKIQNYVANGVENAQSQIFVNKIVNVHNYVTNESKSIRADGWDHDCSNGEINNVNIDDHVNTVYSSGTNAYYNDENCDCVNYAKDCYSNDYVIKTSNVPNEQSTVRGAIKTKGMQIAHLNIITLPGHFDEFISLMQDNEFDIMSLSETRLDEYDIPDNELCIDDYVLYHNDRNRKGGGVAAYVRQTANFTHVLQNDLMPDKLETIVLEIKVTNNRPFLVSV